MVHSNKAAIPWETVEQNGVLSVSQALFQKWGRTFFSLNRPLFSTVVLPPQKFWALRFLVMISMFVIEDNNGGMWHLITLKTPLASSEAAPEVQRLFWVMFCMTVRLAWPWHRAHYLGGVLNGLPDTSSSGLKIPQMKSFFVFEWERHPQKIQSVLLDYCSPDKRWFWQTGGSQLFLDCLVGAVSRQREKIAYEGIAFTVYSDGRRSQDE